MDLTGALEGEVEHKSKRWLKFWFDEHAAVKRSVTLNAGVSITLANVEPSDEGLPPRFDLVPRRNRFQSGVYQDLRDVC